MGSNKARLEVQR